MKRKYKKYTPPAVLVLILVRIENSRKFISTSFLFKQRGGFLSYRSPWCNDQWSRLKCAQCIKRSNCVVSHKEIEPKTFFSNINTGKTLPKNCRNLSMFCLYLLSLKKVFGSICLCEMTRFDLFIHCGHFSWTKSRNSILETQPT